MTLIFSHINPVTGLFAASDLILSRPATAQTGAVAIPMRDQPIVHTNAGSTLAGMMQKTAIFNQTMVSFAGSVIVAKGVISKIRQLSKYGRKRISLKEVMRSTGYNQSELESVSILYHFSEGDGLCRDSHNCNTFYSRDPEESIVSAGSGEWNFFDNTDLGYVTALKSHEAVLGRFLGKVSAHSFLEMLGTDTLDYMYGGWFELASRDGNTFQKIPYAIRFWSRSKGVIATGWPTYFGWYNDKTLVITKGQRVDTPSGVQLTIENTVVSPMFGNASSYIPKCEIKPVFIVNILIDEDTSLVSTRISHDYEEDGNTLHVSPKGLHISQTPAFMEEMLHRDLESRIALEDGKGSDKPLGD